MPLSRNAPFFVPHEKITLSRDGVWLSDGQEITHEGTRELFFRNLHKDGKHYVIQVGRETMPVEIKDTAFFVTRIEGDPTGGYEVVLSDGMKVGLDPGTLRYKPGRLTCRVMTRIGEEEAKFLRAPYFDLLQHLQEDERSYFIDFAHSKITLAKK